ncbi:hypothetical protein L6452_31133 [Arctium lappa]|uniref:Uncharacterized protein n=1 Tax=Arctium lappa TaxID=4217 RepID=A0ACB8ZJ82_ARCLA|nr:hypothetical protein L6452_31133 [Arctium lappa]
MVDRIPCSCGRTYGFVNHRDAERSTNVASNHDPRGIEIDCLLQRVREFKFRSFVNHRNADRGNNVAESYDNSLRNAEFKVELLEFHGRSQADELLDCRINDVTNDDVDDIGLPQYDGAEYVVDDLEKLALGRSMRRITYMHYDKNAILWPIWNIQRL